MVRSVVFLMTTMVVNVCSNSRIGHLKPLGHQRESQGHIDVTEEIPDAKTFFNDYIKASKPLVFKGAAKHLPAYSKWTDEFLKNEFGHIQVDVEEGKKENRSLGAWQWPLKKFLERYKTEDVYLVHTLGEEMMRDLRMLPSISCGGFSKVIQMLVMWFSSGGTKSVLHNDATDNINCLFSGSKKLYMVDWRHREFIDIDAPEGAFSNVNVEAVDLDKYPGISEAPWWEASMEAGDCLFIPFKWYHHVLSFPNENKKNMAVNIWFYHLKKINSSDCENDVNAGSFVPFDELKIGSSNIEAVRFLLLLQFDGDSNISTKDMFKLLFGYHNRGEVPKAMLKKIRSLMDKNGDKMIAVDEIKSLTVDELKEISVVFPGLYSEEDIPEDGSDDMKDDEADEFMNDKDNKKDEL